VVDVGREEKLLEKLEKMIHSGNASTAKYVAEELRRLYNSEIKDMEGKHETPEEAEKRADVVRRMARVHWILNEQALAMKYYTDAIYFSPRSKSAAMAYNGIGEVHRLQGRWAEAKEAYDKARKISDDIKFKEGTAEALRGLGHIHWRLGEMADAKTAYALALSILGKDDRSMTTGKLLTEIANLHNEMDELDEAEASYLMAQKVASENGDKYELARLHNNLGFLFGKRGEWTKAKKEFEKEIKLGEMLNDRRWVGWGLMNMSEAESRSGNGSKGKELIARAVNALKEVEDPVGMAKAVFLEGYAYEAMGERERAFKSFMNGVHAVQQEGMAPVAAYFTLEYSLALERLGERNKALRQAEKARDMYKKLGIPNYVEECEDAIRRIEKV
jgi:tetratricopeptide (TPR) repeat protein